MPSTKHDILLKHGVGMFSSYGIPNCLFWGDPLHCQGLFISDARQVVDLANFECRYNCCLRLYIWGDPFGCLDGQPVLNYYFDFTLYIF